MGIVLRDMGMALSDALPLGSQDQLLLECNQKEKAWTVPHPVLSDSRQFHQKGKGDWDPVYARELDSVSPAGTSESTIPLPAFICPE